MIGKEINGFHILAKLGEGGMAEVYKALDLKLEREVAIKFLRASLGEDEEIGRQRFEFEAKALAKLNHPNIVSVLGYGEYEGRPYLVMDYVPGGTLKDKLGKPMQSEKALALLVPIANALHYAHGKKIIHRDVKPSNILINEDGRPMLTDFGVAKLLESDKNLELTHTDVGIGTPHYMSPEQGRNQKVGPKSDIYSLGVVLYEMVAGKKPYQADTPFAVLLKHIEDPIPNPRLVVKNLPEGTERLILKALSKDPRNRFESMADMAAAMQGAPGHLDFKPTASVSIRTILQLGGGILALLLVAWLWSWLQQRTETGRVLVDEANVLFSDDFEQEVIDDQKWQLYAPIDDTYISFSSMNGFQQVNVQSFPGDKDAGYASTRAWPLASISSIEARLFYDKATNADWLAAGFGLYASDDTHIICDIKTQQQDNNLQCVISNWKLSLSQTLFDGIAIPSGKWVDIRLQIDRGPIEISLYVNDELIGSEYPQQSLLKYLSQPFRPYFNVGTTNLLEPAVIRYDHIIVRGTSEASRQINESLAEASLPTERTGRRISLRYDHGDLENINFQERAPFYIEHGWGLSQEDLAAGYSLDPKDTYIRVYMDDELLEPSFIEQSETNLLWIYNFPEGLTGTHLFRIDYFYICKDWEEDITTCADPEDILHVESLARNVAFRSISSVFETSGNMLTESSSPPEYVIEHLNRPEVSLYEPFGTSSLPKWSYFSGDLSHRPLGVIFSGWGWSQLGLRNAVPAPVGNLVLFRFAENTSMEVFLAHGEFGSVGYRRWGVYILDGAIRPNVFLHGDAIESDINLSELRLHPGEWYYLYLGVNDNGEFKFSLWDATSEELLVSIDETMGFFWQNLAWNFSAGTDYGAFQFDRYYELTPASSQDSLQGVSAFSTQQPPADAIAYDDFNERAGSIPYDTARWELASWDPAPCQVTWSEGSLIFVGLTSMSDAGCVFVPSKSGGSIDRSTDLFEAKILLDLECESNCDGWFSLTLLSSAGYLGCGISGSKDSGASANFGITGLNDPAIYSRQVSVTANEWHHLRVKVDNVSNFISCFLDGELVGRTRAFLITDGYFQMGWARGEAAAIYLDEAWLTP